MKPIVALAALSGLCATLVACGGPPPPPPKPVGAAPAAPKPAAPAATPTPAPAAATTPAASGAATTAAAPGAAPTPATPGAAPTPAAAGAAAAPGAAQPAPFVVMPPVPQATGTAYDPKGRRDPFQALDLIGGPKGLDVSTTKLTGIVRSARTTLALIETSDGIGYILKPGDTLGDGRLMEIAVDSVVFAVGAKPGGFPTNRVVLKLAVN